MKLEVKLNVKGLEELKELLESAKKQAAELEETLNKISKTELSIEFEPKIYKGENHETSSNDLWRRRKQIRRSMVTNQFSALVFLFLEN